MQGKGPTSIVGGADLFFSVEILPIIVKYFCISSKKRPFTKGKFAAVKPRETTAGERRRGRRPAKRAGSSLAVLPLVSQRMRLLEPSRNKTYHLLNIELFQHRCQRLCQSSHGKLCGRVHIIKWSTCHSKHTAHVNNVTILPRFHAGENGLDQTNGSKEIDVKHFFDVFHCHAF